MSRDRPPAHPALGLLVETLQDAVDLLREANVGHTPEPVRTEPPLLEQCLTMCRAGAELGVEPIRTVHHFACTGGTLICKAIASLANVRLLSEVDPLSTLGTKPNPEFAPTDMAKLLRQGARGVSDETLLELFRAQLSVLHESVRHQGGYLVLRDHAHSHFCVSDRIPMRPTLREVVERVAPVRSVLTVRDPADSFLSLRENGWVHFQPATFDEYCRRYLAFLEANEGVPRLRYEDFVADPRAFVRELCDLLQLPYHDMFPALMSMFRLTGDSGRRSDRIEARPPRPDRDPLLEEAAWLASARELFDKLGYNPRPAATG